MLITNNRNARPLPLEEVERTEEHSSDQKGKRPYDRKRERSGEEGCVIYDTRRRIMLARER